MRDIRKYVQPDGTIEGEDAVKLILKIVYTDAVLNRLYPAWPDKEGHAQGLVRQRIYDATKAGHIQSCRKAHGRTYYKAAELFKWAVTTKDWGPLQSAVGNLGIPQSVVIRSVSGVSAQGGVGDVNITSIAADRGQLEADARQSQINEQTALRRIRELEAALAKQQKVEASRKRTGRPKKIKN